MRISVRLPRLKPNQYDLPERCPYGCGGRHAKRYGTKGERKAVRDTRYEEVVAYRYRCLKCGRTYRVYPKGVGRDQQSDRLKAVSVLLYVLGLSYGAVEDFLESLGAVICKTTVYGNVQAAGVASRQLQRREVEQGAEHRVIGTDGTYLKVGGTYVTVQVVVDDETSELLSMDIITSENEEEVVALVEEIATEVKAEVLVSDGADVYRNVSDRLGLEHQICRRHAKVAVDEMAEKLREQMEQEDVSGSESINTSREEVESHLEQLQKLIRERPENGEVQLEQLYDHYAPVRAPKKGQHYTVLYRLRLLITRLWERWGRLTLDQRRDDLDGTNNAAERMIGWWCKERYRPMRGYKRPESVKNVVTLTSCMGARSGHFDMAELYA
jgi:transposase-like protein